MQKKDLIKQILELYPDTRSDDSLLAYKVWEHENPMMLEFQLGYVLKHFHMFGASNIESIGRFRRKIQSEFPELRAPKAVQEARQAKEADYLAIARS